MATILKELGSENYVIGKMVFNFYEHDSAGGYKPGQRLGSMNSFALTVTNTETEVFSNEHDNKQVVLKLVDSTKVDVTMTAAQLSLFNSAAAVQGKIDVIVQDAATGLTRTMVAAGIYKLDGYAVKNVTVMTGTADPAVNNTDYTIDKVSGQIETFVPDLTVTYDVPELLRDGIGFASSTGIRGMIVGRGINAQGNKVMVELWDVELRPSGAREYVSDALQTVTLSGSAYPVTGKEEGYAIGVQSEITDEMLDGGI
jgi:hypothetical protein